MEHKKETAGRINEVLFRESGEDRYGIYQIKKGGHGDRYRYLGMKTVKENHYDVKMEDYELVYQDKVPEFNLPEALPENDILEFIYTKFNIDRPDDFKGHSLSVSDVIALKTHGELKAFYTDSCGFEEIQNFFGEKKQEMLVYHSEITGDTHVTLDIQQYMNDGNLYIGLMSSEDGYEEPFDSLTVNLGDRTPDYCGYVNTNHLLQAEKFIEENSLGTFTGLTKQSGYCIYPLYMFEPDRLRELCPDGLALYEADRGIGTGRKEKCEAR